MTIRSGRGRARLDRERSDLVATVAHELRSPLTGVKGFVQALLNRWDRLNDEQKKLMLDHRLRRRRPAQPADRRAPRRGPYRHRPAPAAPAAQRRRPAHPPDRRLGLGRHRPPDHPRHRRRPARHPRRPRQVHPGGHQPGRERRPARRGHRARHPRAARPRRPGRPGRRPGHRRRRGRGHPERDAPPGVHEVLDGRRARRLRARPLHRRGPHQGARRDGDHRGRPGGGARIKVAWPSALPDLRPDLARTERLDRTRTGHLHRTFTSRHPHPAPPRSYARDMESRVGSSSSRTSRSSTTRSPTG